MLSVKINLESRYLPDNSINDTYLRGLSGVDKSGLIT